MPSPQPGSIATLVGPRQLEVRVGSDGDPLPEQLLIAPDAVGICGTDLELYEGNMAYLTSGFAHYPLVPGHEWTGTVMALGVGVDGFSVGDRVVGECSIGCGHCERCASGDYHLCPHRHETGIVVQPGGMQERLIFPAASAHRVSPQVDAVDAALVEPLAVAYRGLQRSGAGPGDTVVIVGGGTIGLFCAMLAQALGIDCVVIDVNPDRAAFARSLGFEVALTDGVRPSFVIEASGTGAGRRSAVATCAAGGTVVLLGLSGSTSPLDFDDVVVRDITIKGSLGSPHVWPAVIRLLEDGKLRPSVVVSHEFDLNSAHQAFQLAGANQPGVRKIIVRPNARPAHSGGAQ